MAHSHSRTLLAKMGFGDADLKNSRHDLACNYIGLNKEVLTATLQAALPKTITVEHLTSQIEHIVTKGDGKYSTTVGFVDVLATYVAVYSYPMRDPIPDELSDPPHVVLLAKWQSEHPIFRNWVGRTSEMPEPLKTQYQDWRSDVVGDAILESEPERDRLHREHEERLASTPVHRGTTGVAMVSAIEVKVQRVSAGDLIRQMRLYNEHLTQPSNQLNYRSPEPWLAIDTKAAEWRHEAFFRSDTGEAAYNKLLRLRRPTIACLDYDIDDEYAKALTSAGITPVRLGAGFERFVESTKASGAPKKLTEI